MKKRKLGTAGIEIAPLILGGNVFGWTADEAGSQKVLDAFLASGCECIDTADVYSNWVPGNHGGESETILGRWMKARGNRARIVLASKVGMQMGPDKKGLKKDYILRGVEDSLRRLQTDYIDLYQSHQDDLETPVEETLEAYDQLIREGKVRAIGASNYTVPRLAEALAASRKSALPRYVTLQPHYNLYRREEFESGLQELCLKEKVGVIPFYSLASGFLTGKYRSAADLENRKRAKRVQGFLNDRGFRILKALDEVSEITRSNPTRVALAWLLAQPGITAPIASATSPEQLEDLLAATRLELDRASLGILDEASAIHPGDKI